MLLVKFLGDADELNFYEIKYLIAGDENCQCFHWSKCGWSNAAVHSVKDVAKESDEFNQVQTILRQNTCGDDPENHFVNCCGPDQKPSKIHHSIDGNVQPFFKPSA